MSDKIKEVGYFDVVMDKKGEKFENMLSKIFAEKERKGEVYQFNSVKECMEKINTGDKNE